jgi:hypothetical protein
MNELIGNLHKDANYIKCVMQSMNQVIITFNEDGRVNMIENPNLLNLEELVLTMQLTSYEHWLGKQNSNLIDDIHSVFERQRMASSTNYEFIDQHKRSHFINYTIRPFVTSDHSHGGNLKVNTLPSRKMSNVSQKSYNSNISPPSGIILIMELTVPNRYLIEQLGMYI